MSKYATIKCWSITDFVTDPEIIAAEPPTLLLIKKSILKLGYRAFAIDERVTIEKLPWYPKFLLGEEVRFYIDGSGVYRLVNCDLTENELYFERLNVPLGHKPWVFYSWQSDYNPSRSAIKKALDEAVEHINRTLSPRQTLEVVESTRPEDGAKDIVDAIRDNLNKCMLAVFDITNIIPVKPLDSDTRSSDGRSGAKESSKSYPNPNVVFELGYALAQKRAGQIVLVKRERKLDFPDDQVPFDFSHNRRINYSEPAKLKRQIMDILINYFRNINYIKKI
jgi:hypothetical protein